MVGFSEEDAEEKGVNQLSTGEAAEGGRVEGSEGGREGPERGDVRTGRAQWTSGA